MVPGTCSTAHVCAAGVMQAQLHSLDSAASRMLTSALSNESAAQLLAQLALPANTSTQGQRPIDSDGQRPGLQSGELGSAEHAAAANVSGLLRFGQQFAMQNAKMHAGHPMQAYGADDTVLNGTVNGSFANLQLQAAASQLLLVLLTRGLRLPPHFVAKHQITHGLRWCLGLPEFTTNCFQQQGPQAPGQWVTAGRALLLPCLGGVLLGGGMPAAADGVQLMVVQQLAANEHPASR